MTATTLPRLDRNPMLRLAVRSADRMLDGLLRPAGMDFDFLTPAGEPALVPADSVSWRMFRNPVTVFVGGVTAVVLELAEPRVRSGVWEHTSFRTDPVTRLQRTGLAAMATVYGARSRAEAMIAGINRAHGRIAGVTPSGAAYRADDPELLAWVQATASFGFIEAWRRLAHASKAPMSAAAIDQAWTEAVPAAQLYGVLTPPASAAAADVLFAAMAPRLEASPIVGEFLRIMQHAPVLPLALRPLQRVLVRVAVQLAPDEARETLRLGPTGRAHPGDLALARFMAQAAERTLLASHPAVLACRRLGLPEDYLLRSPPQSAPSAAGGCPSAAHQSR